MTSLTFDPTISLVAVVAVLALLLNLSTYIRSARKDAVSELRDELDAAKAETNECESRFTALNARFDGLREENIHLMRLVLGLDPMSGHHLGVGAG